LIESEPPVGAVLSSTNVTWSWLTLPRRSALSTFFAAGAVVAEPVKLYAGESTVYGSALVLFVDVASAPVKPTVPERSGKVTVSTPLGSVAEACSLKSPPPVVVP
jgi:hypothetical protein